MKRKRILTTMLSCILALSSANVFANEITMYLNGTEIAPLPEQHQGAVVQDGTLYLPLRNVFEAMGAIVEYDNTYEEISGGLGGMDYYTTVGAYKVIINGSVYVLEAPVITINNRALVVPQAIVDCFGAAVDWNAGENRVDITYTPDSETLFTINITNGEGNENEVQ